MPLRVACTHAFREWIVVCFRRTPPSSGLRSLGQPGKLFVDWPTPFASSRNRRLFLTELHSWIDARKSRRCYACVPPQSTTKFAINYLSRIEFVNHTDLSEIFYHFALEPLADSYSYCFWKRGSSRQLSLMVLKNLKKIRTIQYVCTA